MSSSGESHSVSNPFRAQGSQNSSSPGDRTHESSFKEVSLVEEDSLVKEKSIKEESSEEEEGSMEEETLMEEEVPTHQKKSQVGTSHSSTKPLMGLMFEISTMTKDGITEI